MSAERLVLPLVPLRDIVVFPFMVLPLFVGREKSVRALEKAMAEQKSIYISLPPILIKADLNAR